MIDAKQSFLSQVRKRAAEELVALVEDELEDKRNPVIVCPHCGKRVK